MPKQILYPVLAPRGADPTEFSDPPGFDPALEGCWVNSEFPTPHRRFVAEITEVVRAPDPAEFADPPGFDPALEGCWVNSETPTPHQRFAAELTGRSTGYAVETEIPDIGKAQPVAPTPHKRFGGFTPDISQPLEPTLFQVAAEITLDMWAQPQQSPIIHKRFASPSVLTSGIDPTLLEFDTRSDWRQPQQAPIPHRKFRPPQGQTISGAEPSLLEFVSYVHWFQPQQEPVPHRTFSGDAAAVSGAEPTLLDAASLNLAWAQPQADPLPLKARQTWVDNYTRGYDDAEFVPPGQFNPADGFPWPTQQSPVPHLRYESPSVLVAGTEPTLLEAFTQNLAWVQPQSDPQPVARRNVHLDQYTRGYDASEFIAPGEFDPANFAWPTQQDPVKHKRFVPSSQSVSGQEPSLLDAFTQNLAWAQPQADPLPIAKRNVWLDQYTRGFDSTEFAFEPETFVIPPQQEPVPHRFYRPESSVVSGEEPTLLDAFSLNFAWAQPQQDPLPVAKRQVYLDQYAFVAEPTDFAGVAAADFTLTLYVDRNHALELNVDRAHSLTMNIERGVELTLEK